MSIQNNGTIFLNLQNGKTSRMTPQEYERQKDKIYADNPTATAVNVSRYNQGDDDILDDDRFIISSANDEPFEVDAKQFRKKRDELYGMGLKGLSVQKVRPVQYFAEQGDKQKAIVNDLYSRIDAEDNALQEQAMAAYKEQRSNRTFWQKLGDVAVSAASSDSARMESDPTTYTGWLKTAGSEYGGQITNYQAAKSLLKDAQTLQNSITKGEVKNAKGLGKFGKVLEGVAQGHIKYANSKDTWDAVVGFENAAAMYGLQQKIGKIIEGLPENADGAAVERAIKKGLSPSERALFEAVQTSGAVSSALQGEMSGAVKAGEIMAMSERMGLEFLMFNGLAGSASRNVKRGVQQYLEKRLVKDGLSKARRAIGKAVSKAIAEDAGAVVGGAIQTAMGPSNWSGVAKDSQAAMQAFMASPAQFMTPETRIKYGIRGPQQAGELLWDGALNYFFENATEFGLGPANKVLGALSKSGYRGLKKLGWDKLATLMSPQAAEFLQKAGIASLAEETGEEINGAIIDYIRGDKNAIKNFFDLENMGILMASFVPTIGVGAGVSAVQRGIYNKKYNDASAAYLNYLVNEKGMPQDKAQEIISSIDGASPEELGHKAAVLLEAVAGSNNAGKEDEAKLILNLAQTARDRNAANGANQLVRDEERGKTRDEIMSRTGNSRFWMTRPAEQIDEAGEPYQGEEEYVDFFGTDGDNNLFIRKENADGSLETIDENGVMRTLTPGQVRGDLESGTLKPRRELTMDEYLDLRNGVKKDAQWQVSQERVGVMSSYRMGQQAGARLTHDDAYAVSQEVNESAKTLLELGADEAVLEMEPEEIAKMAFEERQAGNMEMSEALTNYADALGAERGMREGHTQAYAQRAAEIADAKLVQVSVDGAVTTAIHNGEPVYVTSNDIAIAQDGTVTVIGGTPDSMVRVVDMNGNTTLVPAGELMGAEVTADADFREGLVGHFTDIANQQFDELSATPSPAAKAQAISSLVGHTILLQGENGEVSSVKILNVKNDSNQATIQDVSGKGAEDMVDMTALYDMAQKNDDGTISLDPNAPENQQAEEELPPVEPIPGMTETPAPGRVQAAAPATNLQDLMGSEVEIDFNGEPMKVTVAEISDGNVAFDYEDVEGNPRRGYMTEDEFSSAMRAVAPTQEAEPPAEEETPQAPAGSTLPYKNGEVDWANMFNVPADVFAKRIPELSELMKATFGENALKEVQKAYAASGEAVKKAQDKIDANADLSKSAKLYADLANAKTLRANYEALYKALMPAQAQKAAPQAPAEPAPAAPEVETDVPDISNDTPEAAQKRGYVVQNGNRIDRSAEDAIAAEGKDTKISFTKTDVVDGKYGLMEADRLVHSHISDQENPLHFFAKNWQPKDRNRKDSAVAIQQMANNIRPEEITYGATAYGGAPIVNSRGEVIQGNGRGEALRRAYNQGDADAYKAWLAEHAEEFGLTAEQVNAMQSPVLVRTLDVDDAKAEELGKKEQKDLESGGDATFNAKTLAKKLGDQLDDFLNILFAGDLGDDATFADYIEANGKMALTWLHQNGFINDTEYQNASEITKTGDSKFTEATISAFRALSLEPLFANGAEKVRQGYEKLSNVAKLALQKNVVALSRLDGVIPDLQAALSYLYDYETADPAFQKAKTAEEAWQAIEQWMQNLRLEDGKSEGEVHPSLVANHFAAILKGAKRTKALSDLFQGIVRAMQGEETLYGTEEATDRLGAYRKNNVISEEEENTLRNGRTNDNGAGAPASGEQPGAEQSGGEGVEAGGGETRTEGSSADTEEPGGAAQAESEEGNEPQVETPAKPTTLAEARAYFESLYGKGPKAERYIRVWELTNKKNEAPVTKGLIRQAAATEEPALTAEEAAELEQLGIQVAVDTIEEEGFVKFPAFFKNLVETFGNGIRPFAKSIYLGASAKVSDEIADQMDDRKTVRDFDESVNINEIGNEQDTTGVRQGDERLEPVAGDTAEGAGEQSGTSVAGADTGAGAEDTGAGGSESAGAEGQDSGEQGTLWDTGESDNTQGAGAGNRGGANESGRSGRGAGKTGRGGREVPSSGVDEGESGGVGREPGGRPGSSVDPAVAAEKAENKAYEAEKKAIKNETDTEKLKARMESLKAEISSVEDKNDINRAKKSGQLRAIIERLRDLFSKSANKSETLNQEKVPYESISDPTGEHSIGSVVPSGVADAMRDALKRLETDEGKTVAEFVRSELGYETLDEMFTRDGKDIGLSGEQVDGVGLALHRLKQGKMFIVGDMTGVGKGRQGAAIIRWALRNKKKVLFVTESPDLFADMYKDLTDIGNTDHIPFVINNEEIKDKDTEEVFLKAPGKSVANALFRSEGETLPVVKWKGKDKGKQYNFVMMTYSQAQGARTANAKKKLDWVKRYAKDAIVICDESHNASGESNRGRYFRDIVNGCEGVAFMSATFAKRPDNMVLYGLRSSLRDANMTQEAMVESIQKYGVPMQEIIAAGLFKTGEMVRRERDFSDVVTHWDSPEDTFTEEEIKQARGTYDKTISIVNDIINFQRGVIDPELKKKNQDEFEEANKAAMAKLAMAKLAMAPEGTKVTIREYRNTPYSSQVSNIANLMFYAIKAKKAAEIAIEQIKKGEKPVIAVENTLESYIKDIEGDVPSADFAFILRRGLERSLKYRLKTTVKWINPDTHEMETIKEESSVKDMGSAEALVGGNYADGLRAKISAYSTDKEVMPLMLSPIDYIKRRIEDAGYKCGEITGREWQLVQNPDGTWHKEAIKLEKTKEIASFNGGSAKSPLPKEEVSNAMILNTAGATGISLHASRRFGDQSKRCMIILQPARNVNTEVQVRGRTDRTGQVSRCEYFYVTSPIPAEKKVIMMLRKKLASLDANAAGTENVSSNKVDADDMDNKYGDEVARQFLIDHPEINNKLDSPLEKKSGEYEKREDLLYELLIGIQRMSCATQEMVIRELEAAYKDQIEYLNQNGVNDLSTSTMNLDAVTIDTGVFVKGVNNESPSEFAHDTLIERVEVNVLKKPLTSSDIYARMKKLGVLDEEGKIIPDYGRLVYMQGHLKQ